MDIVLKYAGGGAFVTGVPSRDLTQADLDECGQSKAALISTGLYKPSPQPSTLKGEAGKRSRQDGE